MFSQKKIEWNLKDKLSFDDFLGKIDDSSAAAAASAINIEYKIISQSIWTGKIKIRINAVFDRDRSWSKPEFENSQLLAHEQGHFDIAQIFAEKLQKKVNVEIKNSQDFSEKFLTLYDNLYDEYKQFQIKYEIETNYGTDVESQKKYQALIQDMLM